MPLVTAVEAAANVAKAPATIRYWKHRGWLTPHGQTPRGADLFHLADVFAVERATRYNRGGRPRRHAA